MMNRASVAGVATEAISLADEQAEHVTNRFKVATEPLGKRRSGPISRETDPRGGLLRPPASDRAFSGRPTRPASPPLAAWVEATAPELQGSANCWHEHIRPCPRLSGR